jgi:hypothetical protein
MPVPSCPDVVEPEVHRDTNRKHPGRPRSFGNRRNATKLVILSASTEAASTDDSATMPVTMSAATVSTSTARGRTQSKTMLRRRLSTARMKSRLKSFW